MRLRRNGSKVWKIKLKLGDRGVFGGVGGVMKYEINCSTILLNLSINSEAWTTDNYK